MATPTTISVYPRMGEVYPDAAGVDIEAAGATVPISEYILKALRAQYLSQRDPYGIYLPQDRSGSGTNGGDGLMFETVAAMAGTFGTSAGQICTCLGYRTRNDGGGGTFYWDTGSEDVADAGLVFGASPLGRWKRLWDGRTLHATWFGVRADVVQATDAAVTAGSNIVTAASLTSSDAGKRFLLRTPSSPLGGTATKTNGTNVITGTGTAWLTTLSTPGSPVLGHGIMYCGGQYMVFDAIMGDTSLSLMQISNNTASGLTLYREVQSKGTLQTAGAGTCTVDFSPLVSEAGALLTYGTDDSEALQASLDAAVSLGAAVLVLPAGKIGITRNHGVTGARGLTIQGAGKDRTVIVDLRCATEEVPYLNADYYFGALSALYGQGVWFRDMSFDGSVPRIGMAHSTGGIPNTSGARIGFFMRHCRDSGYQGLGSKGCGARDEMAYADGNSPNFVARECVMPLTNNNAINVGFSSSGCQISDNILNSYYSCIQATGASILVANNECSQDVDVLSTGADMVVLDARGKQKFVGNILRTANTERYSVGCISVFGGVVANSIVEIENNTITDIRSGWYQGDCAAIMINNCAGNVTIKGNLVSQCVSNNPGGKLVSVFGADTGNITIEGNTLLHGNNIASGIVVKADVPVGKVLVGQNYFSGGITSRTAGNFSTNPGLVTVIATGTTVIGSGSDNVVVTVNGTVGLTFPNASTCGGKRVTVKNASTQSGTTTVTPTGCLVDGAATATLVGTNVFKTFLSDGTNWQVM